MASFASPVTYLFVPALRTDRIAKAFAAGAHAVIADLEDAIDPADKAEARARLDAHLGATDVPVWVRVNAVTTPWFVDDVALLRRHESVLAGVMLSKAESATQVDAVGGGLAVIPLIESALGVLKIEEIAGHECVRRLAFGSADFARDTGCDDDRTILAPARMQLVLHSAVRQLPAPVDGVTFALNDAVMAQADAAAAAKAGFGGKLCIHPSQLAPVARGFEPSPALVRWAVRVMSIADAGSGAQRLDGEMIDRPVIERARRVLARRAAVSS